MHSDISSLMSNTICGTSLDCSGILSPSGMRPSTASADVFQSLKRTFFVSTSSLMATSYDSKSTLIKFVLYWFSVFSSSSAEVNMIKSTKTVFKV